AIVTSLIDLTLGIIFLYTYHHDFIRMVSPGSTVLQMRAHRSDSYQFYLAPSLTLIPTIYILKVFANFCLYACINLVSMYTKYLMDCSQRNAFLETRRSIETRYKIEKENGKQVNKSE